MLATIFFFPKWNNPIVTIIQKKISLSFFDIKCAIRKIGQKKFNSQMHSLFLVSRSTNLNYFVKYHRIILFQPLYIMVH